MLSVRRAMLCTFVEQRHVDDGGQMTSLARLFISAHMQYQHSHRHKAMYEITWLQQSHQCRSRSFTPLAYVPLVNTTSGYEVRRDCKTRISTTNASWSKTPLAKLYQLRNRNPTFHVQVPHSVQAQISSSCSFFSVRRESSRSSCKAK